MEISCFLNLMYRIGYAEDIHKLVTNRKLMLGGIHVPFEKGEEAHSDGDVVLHALSEAILGALALGDLGTHFPNTIEFKDIDSKAIFKKVVQMMHDKGFEINNVDISIVLEKPKLRDYILDMRRTICNIAQTEIEKISIKAGTNEQIDEIGRGEAVKAVAIVLLKKKD